MKKMISAIIPALILTSAMPFQANAETSSPAIDYELVGVWYSEKMGSCFVEFCTDGMMYGDFNETLEEFYESREAGSVFAEALYTADGSAISAENTVTQYKISGNTMTVTFGAADYIFSRAFSLGDPNDDGSINALDASAVLTEYALTATTGAPGLEFVQRKAADVNCDGAVNALDASEILGYYAYTATGGAGCFAEYYYE
ncbi:MAG: hypothetical protein IJX77_05590 [Ruminococcus sp.]|nr:hypothetical protein [Ruminococcus sp.]